MIGRSEALTESNLWQWSFHYCRDCRTKIFSTVTPPASSQAFNNFLFISFFLFSPPFFSFFFSFFYSRFTFLSVNSTHSTRALISPLSPSFDPMENCWLCFFVSLALGRVLSLLLSHTVSFAWSNKRSPPGNNCFVTIFHTAMERRIRILLNAQATNERKKRFEKKRKREFYKVKTDEKKTTHYCCDCFTA